MAEEREVRWPEVARTARRLGWFGGTFDPVHAGHLHAARTAQRAFALDAVLFVPAARSPHKPGEPEAGAEDRLEMLRLALADEPAFVPCDVELARGAPSYTVDSLRELARLRVGLEGGELFLVLGSDNLRGLARWRGVEELLSLARPIVVLRAGAGRELLDGAGLAPELVARLAEGFLEPEPVPAAATELRPRLARGERLSELPPAVREYVRRRGIYRRP